jgi:hypothetical protein
MTTAEKQTALIIRGVLIGFQKLVSNTLLFLAWAGGFGWCYLSASTYMSHMWNIPAAAVTMADRFYGSDNLLIAVIWFGIFGLLGLWARRNPLWPLAVVLSVVVAYVVVVIR